MIRIGHDGYSSSVVVTARLSFSSAARVSAVVMRPLGRRGDFLIYPRGGFNAPPGRIPIGCVHGFDEPPHG